MRCALAALASTLLVSALTLLALPGPAASGQAEPGVMQKLDAHTLAAPASAMESPQKLADYLAAGAADTTQKARAIFLWTAVHFPLAPTVITGGGDTGMGIADKGSAGSASTFQKLAELSGLTSEMVPGKIRSLDASGHPQLQSHTWNVVKLDNGQWGLVDTALGARVYGPDHKQITRDVDFYYFLPPADQLKYSHIPDDPRWELLPEALTEPQYALLPYLSPAYFQNGLELVDHTGPVIEAEKAVKILLNVPANVELAAQMEKGGAPMDEYLGFAQREPSGEYAVEARFPDAGEYRLTILARQKGTWAPAVSYHATVSAGDPNTPRFPRISELFRETGSTIFSPLQYDLPAGPPQHFKVKVRLARSVFVYTGKQYLTLEPANDGTFSGDIALRPGAVEIAVRFLGGGTQTFTMASYRALAP